MIVKTGLVVLAAVVCALALITGSSAQERQEAVVEVRVWQDVGDELDIYISARPRGGSWRPFGTIALPLDDGESASGRYRYGDIFLDVPLTGPGSATVEVRVWQAVEDSARIYVSARPWGGDWSVLGTNALPLDDGLSLTGQYRYGDVVLTVPTSEPHVTTLMGIETVGGLAFDHDGNLLVLDGETDSVLRVSPRGVATTLAGGGGLGFVDGPGHQAQFGSLVDVAVAEDGMVYVVDSWNEVVRKVTPEGVVSTVGGFYDATAIATIGDTLFVNYEDGVSAIAADGVVTSVISWASGLVDGPTEQDGVGVNNVIAMTGSSDGSLYLLEEGALPDRGSVTVIRVLRNGAVETLYTSDVAAFGGDLAAPSDIAVDSDGTVYVSSSYHNQILALTRAGELRAVAGTGVGGYLDGGVSQAQFNRPTALALAPDGRLAIRDAYNDVIRVVDSTAGSAELSVRRGVKPTYLDGVGVVTIFSGAAAAGLAGRDGPQQVASHESPQMMAFDTDGGLIVVEGWHDPVIRRVAPNGHVTTLTGGESGSRNGPCDQAQFHSIDAVAVSSNGDIYVSETHRDRIRVISRTESGCEVTTLLEGSGTADGAVEEARVKWISDMVFDGEGNLLFLDSGRIRVVTPDGHVGTAVELEEGTVGPQGALDVDGEGNMFVVGRKSIQIYHADGRRTSVFRGSWADTARGTSLLGDMRDVVVGRDGAIYVVDVEFMMVVRVTAGGETSIVAGAPRPWGDRGHETGGPANEVTFTYLGNLLVDTDGNLLLSDTYADKIWKIPLP